MNEGRKRRKRSVVFALSPDAGGGRLIDPRDPTASTGGGGSRAGFMGLVRAVARLGIYDVTALSTFPRADEEVDGVRYVQWHRAERVDVPDVQFAYYDVTPLVNSAASLRIGSHHTCIPYNAWYWIDVNTAPSQWTVNYLRRSFRPHAVWRVLPNAVEGLEGVVRQPVKGKVIYHTSPDRGLDHLLLAWPEIRAVYRKITGEEATLEVVGDPKVVTNHPPLMRGYEVKRAERMLAGLKAATAAGGLTLHGRLSRPALLRLLSRASCFAFPAEVNAPCETWSISVHESLAIGLPVVLSPCDALGGLWSGLAHVVNPTEAGSPAMGAFVAEVVRVLTDADFAAALSATGKRGVEKWSFEHTAHCFDAIVEDWFDALEREPAAAAVAE